MVHVHYLSTTITDVVNSGAQPLRPVAATVWPRQKSCQLRPPPPLPFTHLPPAPSHPPHPPPHFRRWTGHQRGSGGPTETGEPRGQSDGGALQDHEPGNAHVRVRAPAGQHPAQQQKRRFALRLISLPKGGQARDLVGRTEPSGRAWRLSWDTWEKRRDSLRDILGTGRDQHSGHGH